MVMIDMSGQQKYFPLRRNVYYYKFTSQSKGVPSLQQLRGLHQASPGRAHGPKPKLHYLNLMQDLQDKNVREVHSYLSYKGTPLLAIPMKK